MSSTILPFSLPLTQDAQDALNLQNQFLNQPNTFAAPQSFVSLAVSGDATIGGSLNANSKLYPGSKISIESNGNLNLGANASIVSSTLDARFQAQTDATTVQKDRIDTILSGADLSSDTLKEVFDFATAVKNLEVADVSSLLVKSELLKINQRTVCEVEPCSDIIADSTLAIKMHLTDSYKGWWVEKSDDSNSKVNLYFPVPSGLKVGDINSLYFKAKLLRVSCPFITVYTAIDNLTTNASSWYKSKRTFDSDSFFSTIIPNTRYMAHVCMKPSVFVASDSVAVVKELMQSPVSSSSAGAFADNESVFLIACSTNSSDKGLNGVSLILGEFGIVSKSNHNVYQCSSSVTVANNASYALAKSNAINTNALLSSIAVAETRSSVIESQLDALYQYFLNTSRDVAPRRFEDVSLGGGL